MVDNHSNTGLVDINTALTLLSVPLIDQRSNVLYGAFQVIFARGSEGRFVTKDRVLCD